MISTVDTHKYTHTPTIKVIFCSKGNYINKGMYASVNEMKVRECK